MNSETSKPEGGTIDQPAAPLYPQPTPSNPAPVPPSFNYPPYNYGSSPPPPGWYSSSPYPSRPARSRVFILLTLFILFLLGLSAVAVVLVVNSQNIGNLRTETQTVPLATATSATVNVEMGAGNLKMYGGASDLLNATFEYNVVSWKPIVDYSVSTAGVGVVSVRQPRSTSSFNFGNTRYNWDLRLKNDVPLDLRIGAGVGKSELNFSGLTLTNLEIVNGVGDNNINLSGVHPQNLNVTIRGGVGKTTLQLPNDIGVRIIAHRGLGSIHTNDLFVSGDVYTNRAYGNSSTTINIVLNVGVGDVVLQ